MLPLLFRFPKFIRIHEIILMLGVRYEQMSQLPIIDNLLYNVQRQGKISFYVSCYTYEQTNLGILN